MAGPPPGYLPHMMPPHGAMYGGLPPASYGFPQPGMMPPPHLAPHAHAHGGVHPGMAHAHHHHLHAHHMTQPPMAGLTPVPAAAAAAAPAAPNATPSAAAGTADDWATYTTPDGQKYWGHKVTQVTTWEEPEVVKAAREVREKKETAEREMREHEAVGGAEAGWQEYRDPSSGKRYYRSVADPVKKVTSMPKELRKLRREREAAKLAALAAADADPPTPEPRLASTSPVPAGQPAPAAAAPAPSPSASPPPAIRVEESPPPAPRTTGIRGQDVEEERVYGSRTERKDAFRAMLDEYNIDPDSNWDDAMKRLISDERYTALRARADKIETFKEYCAAKKKAAAQARDAKLAELTAGLEALLKVSEVTRAPVAYEKAAAALKDDPRWRAFDSGRDRERVYDAYMTELSRKLREESRLQKIQRLLKFGDVLKEHGVVCDEKWSTLARELDPADLRYAALTDDDRRLVFDEYTQHLQNERRLKLDVDERGKRRRLRAARRAFTEALARASRLHGGECLHHLSGYSDWIARVSEDTAAAVGDGDAADPIPSHEKKMRIAVCVDALRRRYEEQDLPVLTEYVVANKLTDPTGFSFATFEGLVGVDGGQRRTADAGAHEGPAREAAEDARARPSAAPPGTARVAAVAPSSITAFLAVTKERVAQKDAALDDCLNRLAKFVTALPPLLSETPATCEAAIQKEPLWTALAAMEPTLERAQEVVRTAVEGKTAKRKRSTRDDAAAEREGGEPEPKREKRS